MPKDDDRLKPPPGFEKLKDKLALPAGFADKLALPPHLKLLFQQISRQDRQAIASLRVLDRKLPAQVQEVVDWLATQQRDPKGNPEGIHLARGWLERELGAVAAKLLFGRIMSPPKRNHSPTRDVIISILLELYTPDGPPPSVTTYKLMQQIDLPLWAKAWRQLYPGRKAPLVPGKGTVADARRALKNLPR